MCRAATDYLIESQVYNVGVNYILAAEELLGAALVRHDRMEVANPSSPLDLVNPVVPAGGVLHHSLLAQRAVDEEAFLNSVRHVRALGDFGALFVPGGFIGGSFRGTPIVVWPKISKVIK